MTLQRNNTNLIKKSNKKIEFVVIGSKVLNDTVDFELNNDEMDVPFLSSFFMFFHYKNLINECAFDERYFMYLEDTDLSRWILNMIIILLLILFNR